MILTTSEARTLGRPIGQAVADNKIQAFINEAEQQVKRYIGGNLYHDINDPANQAIEPYKTLLSGGDYQDGDRWRNFRGLKVATAYLVDAKMMMTGDIESTRYGYVQKQGEHSDHINERRLSSAYNEITAEAQQALKEAMLFARHANLLACCNGGGDLPSNGLKITKIRRK